ncbi:AAA family ATPase [Sulfolobus sp. E11-6]|uniref:AAA family ATPase n=1 Tax=Sulfolobus sp. E11-6 TaxID=2663020 RepID=UPI0013866B8C|nr:AAA family ATPase [Sulfolobus sp. E11-6]
MQGFYSLGKISSLRTKVRQKKRIKEIYYELDNKKQISPFMASAMTNEVTAIFLPLISANKPALVLIEEPESELHPAYQILVGLALLSLVREGYKFVISTHSDLFASLLGDLLKYKPNKEKILEFLKGIVGENAILNTIAEDVENVISKKENSVRAYYFEGGKVKEVDASELNYNVPGITKEILDKVVEFEFELSMKGERRDD